MKSLCVFCGSSKGNNPKILAAAHELADLIVKEKLALVYGGASVGLMDFVGAQFTCPPMEDCALRGDPPFGACLPAGRGQINHSPTNIWIPKTSYPLMN